MSQDNETTWVKAERDATTRILHQIAGAIDDEEADLATQMTVVTELLLLIWVAVCPGCRQSTMTLLRERLPQIAAHAAELAALDDTSSVPPVCH